MSLARALTTRRKAKEPTAAPAYLGRAASQRAPNAKPIKRADISLPVSLLSTTNVLSYEAPNIPNAPNVRDRGGRYFTPDTLSSAISVSSSTHSDNDSDNSASDHSHDTDATSIDLSSPETSQGQFTPFGKSAFPKSPSNFRTVSTASTLSTTSSSSESSPKIPARAASHSKKAHVLSHTRSVLARTPTKSQSGVTRHDSLDMFNPAALDAALSAPPSHPFGKELEQLDEATEEFGHAVRDADFDADQAIMAAKGLVRFCATDYMQELAALSTPNPFSGGDAVPFQAMAWI